MINFWCIERKSTAKHIFWTILVEQRESIFKLCNMTLVGCWEDQHNPTRGYAWPTTTVNRFTLCHHGLGGLENLAGEGFQTTILMNVRVQMTCLEDQQKPTNKVAWLATSASGFTAYAMPTWPYERQGISPEKGSPLIKILINVERLKRLTYLEVNLLRANKWMQFNMLTSWPSIL